MGLTLHERNEKHLHILRVLVFIYSVILIVAGFVLGGVFGFIFLFMVIAVAKGTIDRAERRALVREQREAMANENINVTIGRR